MASAPRAGWGTEKAVKLMERETWDEPLLVELGQTMSDASICGLGQAASPLSSVLRYFRGNVDDNSEASHNHRPKT